MFCTTLKKKEAGEPTTIEFRVHSTDTLESTWLALAVFSWPAGKLKGPPIEALKHVGLEL